MYKVEFDGSAKKKDLRKIPRAFQLHIKDVIEKKLMKDPYKYGLPLHGQYKGFYKFRIGDYRVIYKVDGDTIIVYRIASRGDAY